MSNTIWSSRNILSSNDSTDIKDTNIFDDGLMQHEGVYEVPVGIIVLLSIFYGSISIIAVIGNSLVIWIVGTSKQMQTVTNFFIANLALSDVLIGMFSIPFQFQAALLQRWNLPHFMCPICPFVQLLSVCVSVLTLTAIAVDRHRAIINPFRARPSKRISKAIIIAIWILSFLLALPTLIYNRVVYFDELIRGKGLVQIPVCSIIIVGFNEIRIYKYIVVLVQYLIPLSVISFVYIQMAVRLWGSKTPGNAQGARDVNLLKNKKRVIKMLVIVVAVFGLCWLPLQTYHILQVTWDSINNYRYINIIFFCCDWLAMSNSCYNPFIYGIYNEKFKREFKKRFPICCSRSDIMDGDKTVSVYTRASSIRSSHAISSVRKSGTNINFNNENNIELKTINNGLTDVMYTFDNENLLTKENNFISKELNKNLGLTTKNYCSKCIPSYLYQQVNVSPNSSNKNVLYKSIDTNMSPNYNKCSCQTKEKPTNVKSDLNYNNEDIGLYPNIPMNQSQIQTYAYKSDNQKRLDEISDNDIYILLKIESNEQNENKEMNDDPIFKDIVL